jgi:uncharacterized protein
MTIKIFVNLAVKDLKRSMEFFRKLGFTFNPKFTDDKAACMIINEDGYVMLLVESFFNTFIKKKLVDAQNNTEVLVSLSTESKEKVDELFTQAISLGATRARDPQDFGFMFSKSFCDLDGHTWEIVWMDMEAVENGPPK